MNHYISPDGQVLVKVPLNLIQAVRRFVQDFPEVNDLVEGEETTDEQIGRFLVDVIEEWNSTPPVMPQFQLEAMNLGFNPSLRGIRPQIVNAASARLMKSILIKLARNDMAYTAGNVTIQPNAVWRNLQPIIQDLELQYKQFRSDLKIAQNVSAGWGVAHSEFYQLSFLSHQAGTVSIAI